MKVKLKCTAQPSIITAHFAEDNGRWVFVICRQGGENAMNIKLDVDKPFLAEVEIKFLKYLDDSQVISLEDYLKNKKENNQNDL